MSDDASDGAALFATAQADGARTLDARALSAAQLTARVVGYVCDLHSVFSCAALVLTWARWFG